MALGDLTSISSVSTEEHTRTSTERVGDEYRFGTTAREVVTVTDTEDVYMKPDRLCLHLDVADSEVATVKLPPARLCTGRVAVITMEGDGNASVESVTMDKTDLNEYALISNGSKWVKLVTVALADEEYDQS